MRLRYAFLITILVTGTSYAQTWERQYPSAQGQHLQDVALVDDQTAVAVGDYGVVVRTGDAGATWTVIDQAAGVTVRIKDVDRGTNSVFAVTDDDILRSDDGGVSWYQLPSPTLSLLRAISFGDDNTGFLCTDAGVYRSTTGGATWIPIATPNGVYTAVDALNANTVMVAGFNAAISNTSGASWADVSAAVGPSTDVRFYDMANIVVAADDQMKWSNDYGASWNTSGVPENEVQCLMYSNTVVATSTTNFLYGVSYGNHVHGVGCSYKSHGYIRCSTNQGASWTSEWAQQSVNGIDALPSGTAVAVGAAGQIQWSTDHGVTWSVVSGNPAPTRWTGISFYDSDTAIAFDRAGSLCGELETNLAITADGGATWTTGPAPYLSFLYDLAFTSPTDVYAVGSYTSSCGWEGVVYESNDLGQNWTKIFGIIDWGSVPPAYAPQYFYFYAIDICDGGTGVIVGESNPFVSPKTGEVLTIDGGGTVTRQTPIGTRALRDVSMRDCTTALAVGDYGSIWRTTDGGVSWTQMTSGTTMDLAAVAFPPSGRAYAAGEGGTLLVSDDGGVSWSPLASGTTDYILELSFADEWRGMFAAGSTVYRTSNRGESWDPLPLPTGATIRGGTYFPDNGMSVVTAPLEVYRTSGPATAADAGTPSRAVALAQSYPNPFNPSTTIRYTLTESARVTLQVFTAAGALVATLEDRSMPAGTYETSWDGTDRFGNSVGSGVYFYRLATPGMTVSRKMVLLK